MRKELATEAAVNTLSPVIITTYAQDPVSNEITKHKLRARIRILGLDNNDATLATQTDLVRRLSETPDHLRRKIVLK